MQPNKKLKLKKKKINPKNPQFRIDVYLFISVTLVQIQLKASKFKSSGWQPANRDNSQKINHIRMICPLAYQGLKFFTADSKVKRADLGLSLTLLLMSFPGGSDGKESACNTGNLGSIPELGRSPGGGHGNPLQYTCLENPHGQRNLVGYSPWGRKDSDTTE